MYTFNTIRSCLQSALTRHQSATASLRLRCRRVACLVGIGQQPKAWGGWRQRAIGKEGVWGEGGLGFG